MLQGLETHDVVELLVPKRQPLDVGPDRPKALPADRPQPIQRLVAKVLGK